MGPFAYNIFINDLLLQLARNSEGNIYNYADNNTVSACDKTIDDLHNKLTKVSGLLLQWFTENYMQANASKFHYIMFGSADKVPGNSVLHIHEGVDLKSTNCVKLLTMCVRIQNTYFFRHLRELVG